jgi:hypothetical protein
VHQALRSFQRLHQAHDGVVTTPTRQSLHQLTRLTVSATDTSQVWSIASRCIDRSWLFTILLHLQTQALVAGNCDLASYDVVAVQPLSDRVLQQANFDRRLLYHMLKATGRFLTAPAVAQACSSLDVDLISIDLGQRLPFKLRSAQLRLAFKRGVHFEVRACSHRCSPPLDTAPCCQSLVPTISGCDCGSSGTCMNNIL